MMGARLDQSLPVGNAGAGVVIRTGSSDAANALMGKNVVYHSHMAAVVEELRHKDIGYRLKLAQRERAVDAGIPLLAARRRCSSPAIARD